MRAPSWLIALLILVIVGIGIYGYFTTPLPFGLSNVIRTPGGSTSTAPPGGPPVQAGSRTAVGQPLVLGAASVVIQSTLRNQDVTATSRGPAGTFTVIQLELQNGGTEPLTPKADDFRLVDDRGRRYAVDLEATRAVNATARHRVLFDATVPPGGRLATTLAFETPGDVGALTLRVALGYGEVELPR
ncbi:MAG TPA: DUF4352 domain-containing protein [Chloroflexota bacterium]|jgi:hypothetical protein